MAYGRGRGRGRGGFRPATQTPYELFPEIEDLGTAEHTKVHHKLIRWSYNLQKDAQDSSPYYYEEKDERLQKQKQDIERYSTRNSGATNSRPPLWDYIKLDSDHMPAELAPGRKRPRATKKVKWNPGSGMQKLDLFEMLEQKSEGQEKTEKNEDEEDEDDEANEEDEGEYSDEGDYEQAEYCDDDEDDYNMADDNDDEPVF